MHRFVSIDLISGRDPDESMILPLRHLLKELGQAEQTLVTMKAHFSARGMTMSQCTIVDDSLIAAPSSTKNKDGKWDPEVHQAKKGNQWYFGMMLNIGVGRVSGLIDSVVTSGANVYVPTTADQLLRADEEIVYGEAVPSTGVSPRNPQWSASPRSLGW